MTSLIFGSIAQLIVHLFAPSVSAEHAAWIANAPVSMPPVVDGEGIGSRFGDPGDRWVGGRMACAPHDRVNSSHFVCAHRSYPCGTILIIEYPKTGKRSWCVVADRGPYGASVFAPSGDQVALASGDKAWYIKISKTDHPPDHLCPGGGCSGRWRGVIDMSPAVSKAMGHDGWGAVKVWKLSRVVNFHRYMSSKKPRPTS